MSQFYTEKQTEQYLELEARELPMPDGSVRLFHGFRLLWLIVDELQNERGYSLSRLAEFAVQETEISGEPLEVTFPGVVAFMDRHLLRGKPLD